MFHRPSFSSVSFSRISFNGATQPVEQSGRSGYWRLFYYQMQEEALEKGKLAAAKPTQEKEPYLPPVSKKVAPARASKNEDIPEEIEAPFPKLKPFTPLPDTPDYLQEMWRITYTIREMVANFKETPLQLRQGISPQDLEDEEDLELLLLSL